MLKWSKENSKVKKLRKIEQLQSWLLNKRKIVVFDRLAGHTCPFAKDCFSKVVVEKGNRKIKDGPDMEFRCFAASIAVLRKHVYNLQKHNTDLINQAKTVYQKYTLLKNSMPKNAGIIRIHSSGDFNNQAYFDAWLRIAVENQDRLFYAYTKSLPYWVRRIKDIPPNMVLTASRGGRRDDLIDKHNLRESIVVFYPDEADKLGLELDNNDSHAARPDIKHQDFALLIHGTQPAGTKAASALATQRTK